MGLSSDPGRSQRRISALTSRIHSRTWVCSEPRWALAIRMHTQRVESLRLAALLDNHRRTLFAAPAACGNSEDPCVCMSVLCAQGTSRPCWVGSATCTRWRRKRSGISRECSAWGRKPCPEVAKARRRWRWRCRTIWHPRPERSCIRGNPSRTGRQVATERK